MSTFAVMAHRASPTNTRLGRVLTPAQCITRLQYGDVVLGRLDVRQSLDGIEAGLWALDRLAQSGVKVLNDPDALATAHDKLATARRTARGRRSASGDDPRRALAGAAGAADAGGAQAAVRQLGPRRRALRDRGGDRARRSPTSRPATGSARPAQSPRS